MTAQSGGNTEFEYRYRDASNYKWHASVVLAGSLRLQDIKPYLIDGEFFVPELVGLKCLTPEIRNEDDHDWHEVIALNPTSAPANFIPAEEFLRQFQTQHRKGWVYVSSKGWGYV